MTINIDGSLEWDEGVQKCLRDGTFEIRYANHEGTISFTENEESIRDEVPRSECCLAYDEEMNPQPNLLFACEEIQ